MNTELDTEGKSLFRNITSKARELKTYMKQLYPYLVKLTILTGDETYDEVSNDILLKQYLSKNIALFLDGTKSTDSNYGKNLISEFDLYHSCKTNDELQV